MRPFYKVLLLIIFFSGIITTHQLSGSVKDCYNIGASDHAGFSSSTLLGYSLIHIFPQNNSLFDSGNTSIGVQWQWELGAPSMPYSFEVEYYINGSYYNSGLLSSSVNVYSINGLLPASAVQWRVCSIDEFDARIYSSWTFFYIKRGSPLYVKENATGNGNSWNNAASLQFALANAIYSDELWVAAGVYKPTGGTSRDISFQVKNGMMIYGGFAGNEVQIDQRNWVKNQTILSGDIGIPNISSDNSYNILKIAGTMQFPVTDKTIIDGLIIEGGNADNSSQGWDRGAGMQLIYASPIIVNTWFRNNNCINFGGAVFGDGFSKPKFYNTIFSKNYAQKYGGAALANAEMHFINCLFYANQAGDRGGAVNGPSSPNNLYVYNSIIWGNKAPSNPQLYNSVVGYSIVEGGYTGIWVLSDDPQMINPSADDFRMNSLSPALNSGGNDYLPAWLLSDYAGNPRKDGVRVDIGIFEGFVPTPFPLLPANNYLFEASVTEANITWEWKSSVPTGIIDYSVEYYINNLYQGRHDGISGLTWTITGLKPIDFIRWRVAGVNGQGDYFWSPWSNFYIRRDCPLYVKPDGSGSGNSWSDAADFQDALSRTVWGDQIWLAAGTYKPVKTANRSVSFDLKDGIKIYGGFIGVETSVNDRNITENRTVLSGDIGSPGVFTDNSYHVITAIGTSSKPITSATLLDGFIVECGNAEVYTGNNQFGGGLYLIKSSPVVVNVWFRNNISKDTGGAIYGDDQSNPVFANVIFSNNSSDKSGGAVFSNASMVFHNCLWYNNQSGYWGGAADASTNNTTLVFNSISWSNTALYGYHDFRNIRVRSSLVEDGSGIGSLTGNPMFVDPANNNFKLIQNSPAYNSGNNTQVPAWLTVDMEGGSRIKGAIVDMGPFELDISNSVLEDTFNNKSKLICSPNPVKTGQVLTIHINNELPNNASLRLIDLYGNAFKAIITNGATLISHSMLPGLYVFEVELANGNVYRDKILIVK